MFGRATIRLGIGPHSSVMLCYEIEIGGALCCQRMLAFLFLSQRACYITLCTTFVFYQRINKRRALNACLLFTFAICYRPPVCLSVCRL